MPLAPAHARPPRARAIERRPHQEVADELQDYVEQLHRRLHRARTFAAAKRAGPRSWNWAISPPPVNRCAPTDGKTRRHFFDDLRYAVRRLLHRPGFTAVSVLTLALGIGSTTAIFSVINGVLLKPLPYPNSEQLVSLMHTAPGINITELDMAPSLYFVYSDETRVLRGRQHVGRDTSTVTGLAEPEEVPTVLVTNRLLPALGVQPAMGRGFTAADDDPKSPRTVMLSDGYWRTRFGGDPSVLGRSITIDGDAM